jgi:hypothetical protein
MVLTGGLLGAVRLDMQAAHHNILETGNSAYLTPLAQTSHHLSPPLSPAGPLVLTRVDNADSAQPAAAPCNPRA